MLNTPHASTFNTPTLDGLTRYERSQLRKDAAGIVRYLQDRGLNEGERVQRALESIPDHILHELPYGSRWACVNWELKRRGLR